MSSLREVAEGVLVATSRLYALNSVVVVGNDGGALLVDPGWAQDELDELATSLSARGLTPVAGLSTHAHYDHLLWHPSWADTPRWASAGTARLAKTERASLLADLGDGYRTDVLAAFGAVIELAGTIVPWNGPRVELLVHNAHAPGHTAAWIPSLAVLIAGDMLSDVELPLLEGSSLADYRAGLALLSPVAEAASLAIPGHGTATTDGAARVAADVAYLDELAAGSTTTDARWANPDMAEAHAANVGFAAGG